MKRWLAMVVAVFAAVFLLALCIHWPWDTSAPTEPTTMKDPIPSQSNQGTTAPKDEPDILIRYIPEEVENPDNLPVLKWVCLTQENYGLSGNRPIHEAAMREVNQMLADRNMPFRLQVITFSRTKRSTDPIRDWFSVPEAQEALKDADLIYGYMLGDDMQKYYVPITEYVAGDAEPTLNSTAFHELDWIRTTVDGEIYGIPSKLSGAGCNGWSVNPEIFQKYGLTVEDFAQNYWEMDDVFAKIYSENGNEPFLWEYDDGYSASFSPYLEYPSIVPMGIDFLTYYLYQRVGYCCGIDYSSGVPEIVNLYNRDPVRATWAAYSRYKKAGYTIKPSSMDGGFSRIKINFGPLSAGWVHTHNWYDECEYTGIPLTNTVFTITFPEGFMSGVAAVSQHKEEAVQLLNLIAEDEEFRMRLLFGKEGRDYEIEDGYYKITVHEDGTYYSMNVLSPLSFFCGLTAEKTDKTSSSLACGTDNDNDWYPAKEGKTKQESRIENLNSAVYLQCPVVFDYSGFEKELAAIEAVCRKYFDRPYEETVAVYDQMLQEFKDAGSEKIIAELQRQLDAWLADNPVWQ